MARVSSVQEESSMSIRTNESRSAALATMLFFAFVDPALVEQAMSYPMEFSRMTGYALGFFFFWLMALFSSAISIYLLWTARRNSGPDGDRD